jgi:hypothetical protein
MNKEAVNPIKIALIGGPTVPIEVNGFVCSPSRLSMRAAKSRRHGGDQDSTNSVQSLRNTTLASQPVSTAIMAVASP